ncbi:hypothetical protein Wcon_01294 [Wolbachia endosymbiont of Cylisticus convexus]|uniref:hypothetical protein n=1 Tax=Wolbachia endosymbiont of Cylisticus convexus TaxID=118728 RepID=UPI000E178342|nr:hypothetical protein [Wolbachia endosymbiont of Cylisticus convexus]RDD34610.1 hypothetical protein Wcon_01294 [Wolbachia endosymbiont of Cylisticus convexus]
MEYKDKHGELPKTVMLVDDDVKNIQKINEFVASMSKREEWLEKNGLSIEEIQKIKFEGARVPKEDKDVGYLERVQEFVNANLVQEPIYENLKKEEPIYQNLQDIQRSLSETVPKEPIYQNNENRPPLPPKKGNQVMVWLLMVRIKNKILRTCRHPKHKQIQHAQNVMQ